MMVPVSLVFALAVAGSAFAGQQFTDFTTPLPLKPGETLVVGFLGAWERWNDPERGVRKVVLQLRDVPGVRAESVENHSRELAVELVMKAFDHDGNGTLDTAEASAAKLIIFGQSLGGSATVKLAKDLELRGVPVGMTIQVDSVGIGDEEIPANVIRAANFYQRGLLPFRGESQIRAADPAKTQIIGNFEWEDRFVYRLLPNQRFRRTFGGGHARMELDPLLWARIQALIVGAVK